MRQMIRAGLAATAALGALALANGALAAVNPRLDVTSAPQAKSLTIGARLGQSDDWVGRLQVYVPSGYRLSAPSATGAPVTVQAIETQIGPSNIAKLPGSLKAARANDAAAVSWATANCDNTTHAATWMIGLQGADASWTFPVFVDSTSGSETQLGSQKLVFCLGPREPGGQNPMGNKLLTLSLTLAGVSSPAKAGDYTWRSLWTPFTGTTDTLDQNASVEAQSVVHVAGGVLTIAAHKSGGKVVLSGKLVVNGEAMDGITIRIKHGASAKSLVTLAAVKTSKSGAWTTGTKLKRPSYFQAGATIAGGDLGTAGCKASFGLPCASATSGGAVFLSSLIHVR